MTSRVHRRITLTALTLAAGVLATAAAVSQAPAVAERAAFAAVLRSGEDIERAADGNALWRAAGQAVDAAEQAAGAFSAADRGRDAALVRYRATLREALAGAVTCRNGYPCTNGRVDPFEGFAAAFAAHFELLAAVSAANAVYVDAVGIPGGGEARDRALRIREIAARMRALEASDEVARWNALVRSVGVEIDAGNALHRRATEARHAADRALIDDVTRLIGTLYTVELQVAPAGARDVSPAVFRAGLAAARDALNSLRALLVEAASSEPDVAPGGSAETAVAGNVAPDGSAETNRLGTAPGGNGAPSANAATAEPGRADAFGGWVRALTVAARTAEQAAGEAEAAVRDRGSSSSRASSCSEAEALVAEAAARVTSLTIGDDRPPPVPARTGRETYSDLFYLLDAAKRRARAACSSIEQPD